MVNACYSLFAFLSLSFKHVVFLPNSLIFDFSKEKKKIFYNPQVRWEIFLKRKEVRNIARKENIQEIVNFPSRTLCAAILKRIQIILAICRSLNVYDFEFL